MSPKAQQEPTTCPTTGTIPELEHSKTAVLNTLASRHSSEATNPPSTGLSPGIAANLD
jgi:hypothetical protein